MDETSVADMFLNFFAIALFAVLLAGLISAAMDKTQPKKKCLHKWSAHPETKKLTCTECNYVAGSPDPNGSQ